MELLGRKLGPCVLESVLGSGGMGVVYRGRHLALDRPVAVKVIRGEGADAVLDRWLVEARAAARVEDSRVVRIFDAGREGELRYVVMQLIEGRSLAEIVEAEGPMSVERAARLAAELALALASVHRQGVVHRDVKPSNVMLGSDGGVKLVDFGVAATAGQPRGAAGSSGFMAPEQSYGEAADPRQDIYGVGGCLWFCLTGKPPIADWTPRPEDVAAEVPGLTPYAAGLLASLLAPEPDRRPADASVVAAALRAREMTVALAPSGSPTDLLEPPPVPPKPAVSAAVAPRPRPREAIWPAPPPPLPEEARFSAAAGLLLAGAFLAVFGPAWARVGPADWLGAGAAAVLVLAALTSAGEAGAGRRAAAGGLFVVMAAALTRSAGPWSAPQALEAWAAGGIGLTAAAAGFLVGFGGGRRDRPLAWLLLLGGAGALALAAAGKDLGAGASWLPGAAAALAAKARALRDSGGLRRWSGLLALYAVWRVKKASC